MEGASRKQWGSKANFFKKGHKELSEMLIAAVKHKYLEKILSFAKNLQQLQNCNRQRKVICIYRFYLLFINIF